MLSDPTPSAAPQISNRLGLSCHRPSVSVPIQTLPSWSNV
jgi:hypothetical protein